MKTQELHINELIKKMSEKIQETLDSIFKESPKMLLGYNNVLFMAAFSRITTNLSMVNKLMELFVSFLPGKNKSFDLFTDEVLPLSLTKDVDLILREKYMEHHKLEVHTTTGAKLRKDFIVRAIDLTPEEEQLIVEMVGLVNSMKAFKVDHYEREWYNQKECIFVFTDAHKQELKDKFKRFLANDELGDIIFFELAAIGLNGLLRSGYSSNKIQDGTLFGQNLVLYNAEATVESLQNGVDSGFNILEKGGPRFKVNMDGFLGTITEISEKEILVEYLGKNKNGKISLKVNGEEFIINNPRVRLGSKYSELHNSSEEVTDIQGFLDLNQYDKFYQVVSHLYKQGAGSLKKIISEESKAVVD